MQQRSQQQRRCSLQVPILNAEIVSSAFTQGIYLFDGMVLLHLEFEIFFPIEVNRSTQTLKALHSLLK